VAYRYDTDRYADASFEGAAEARAEAESQRDYEAMILLRAMQRETEEFHTAK